MLGNNEDDFYLGIEHIKHPIMSEDEIAALCRPMCESEVPISTAVKPLSTRGQEWKEFSDAVLHHIETYTIPQYGDKGDDMLSTYDTDHGRIVACISSIQKYTCRWRRNARPQEAERDFLKIAHYAAMIWGMMQR